MGMKTSSSETDLETPHCVCYSWLLKMRTPQHMFKSLVIQYAACSSASVSNLFWYHARKVLYVTSFEAAVEQDEDNENRCKGK